MKKRELKENEKEMEEVLVLSDDDINDHNGGFTHLCNNYRTMKLTKQDRENLVAFLEEYLVLFKNKEEHKKAHKKEPCLKCKLAKRLLNKLKK